MPRKHYKVIDYREHTRLGRNYGLRLGRKPICIIIHATAGHKAGDLAALSNGNAAGRAGVHQYIIKNGTRYWMVPARFAAYHAGLSQLPGKKRRLWGAKSVNRISLGIEIENLNDGKDEYTEDQLRSCAEIVHEWGQRFKIPRDMVFGHCDVSPGRKTDPRGFPWAKLWKYVDEL